MHDTITETYTPYEQACSRCIADLYRVAYLALADSALAERIVTQTCVSCVHTCGSSEDPIEIRYCLLMDLCRRCRRCREFGTAGAGLSESLRTLSADQRLRLAAKSLFGYEV